MNDTSCEGVALRLVEGDIDPALERHVRSCLRCFRAAAELREVPRLSALLREGEPAPDPGEDFWARLPAELGQAFDRRRAPRRSPWARLGAAFRAPLPAAFAGAALTALVAVTVVDRAPPREAPATDLEALIDGDDLLEALDLPEMQEAIAHIAAGDEGEPAELPASPAEELELLDGEALQLVAQAFGEQPF